jgi:hypothetical protein
MFMSFSEAVEILSSSGKVLSGKVLHFIAFFIYQKHYDLFPFQKIDHYCLSFPKVFSFNILKSKNPNMLSKICDLLYSKTDFNVIYTIT